LFWKEHAVGLQLLLLGHSLSTTMMVWKFWESVQAKIGAFANKGEGMMHPPVCCVYALMVVPIALDFLALFGNWPAFMAASIGGVFTFFTACYGLAFLRKASGIFSLINVVASDVHSGSGGNSTSETSRAARKQMRRISQLGILSGFALIGTVGMLVWYIFDRRLDAQSSLCAAFFALSWGLRYLASWTQIEMCRIPSRLRQKSQQSKTFVQ